jgi:hypothetical protein
MKHIRRPFVTVTYLFATNSARSAGLSERCHTKPNPRPRGCDIPRDYCDRANSSYFSTPCPVSWSMDTAQHERRREENCSGSLRNQYGHVHVGAPRLSRSMVSDGKSGQAMQRL